MPSVSLSEEELKELKTVLSTIHLKERTGEIGILHGLDRFVSAKIILKKKEVEALDAIAKRCGLAGLKRFIK